MREKGYRSAAAKRLQTNVDAPDLEATDGAGESDDAMYDMELPEGPEGFNVTAEDAENIAKLTGSTTTKKKG